MRNVAASRSITLVEEHELDQVARILQALRPSEAGPCPGVQLTLVAGGRRWTVSTRALTATVVGGAHCEGHRAPVWLPARCVFHAAELSRTAGVCGIRIDDQRPTGGGVTALLSAVGGSGRFDLPERGVMPPATSYLPQVPSSDAVVDVANLARALRGATRRPIGVATPEVLIAAIRVQRDSVAIGVDTSSDGGAQATYQVPAAVERAEAAPVAVDVDLLHSVVSQIESGDVNLLITELGQVVVADGRTVLVAQPVGATRMPTTPGEALAALGGEQQGDAWVADVGGVAVTVAPSAVTDECYEVRAVLASQIRPEPEVLAELNAMNAHLPAGRLWIDATGDLLVGAEVTSTALVELPNVVEAIGRSAVGISAFLGGLLEPDGDNERPGLLEDPDG